MMHDSLRLLAHQNPIICSSIHALNFSTLSALYALESAFPILAQGTRYCDWTLTAVFLGTRMYLPGH